ncbi:MAG: acetyltransferase [Tannerellaceae bacterium]|jgi:sugar O-acyltransferase (sialic acid O-acetyltransferase NeuD family)|nr:acetyltransferase [Tannerellaceae bacterium]
MYIYGAGGHAKVILEILEDSGISVDALFADNASVGSHYGYMVYPTSQVKGPLIIGIGDNYTRYKIACSLKLNFSKAIHPSAIMSRRATIKDGTVVMQGAVIQSCSEIGKHCIVNSASSIDHECVIESFVHIAPHATLCGNVKVGEGSWIGAGATVLPGVTIGKWAIIGAGSVVRQNIPDMVVAAGNKCRIIRSSQENNPYK